MKIVLRIVLIQIIFACASVKADFISSCSHLIRSYLETGRARVPLYVTSDHTLDINELHKKVESNKANEIPLKIIGEHKVSIGISVDSFLENKSKIVNAFKVRKGFFQSERKLEKEYLKMKELNISNIDLTKALGFKKFFEGLPVNGPNCFNTAARFYGVCSKHYTGPKKMLNYLSSYFDTVKIKDPNMNLSYGDVIVVWANDVNGGKLTHPIHASVYLGNGVFFEKAGADERLRYGFFNFYESIYNDYKLQNFTVHRFRD